MEFATLLSLIIRVCDFFDALARRFTEGREYRRARFGSLLGEIYYWVGILNTEDIQRYHFNINLWTKAEALSWRDSYVAKCSAISVAAAIFASVGLSALALEGISTAHWSVSALLTASMVLGILSVCSAVSLQNAVGSLSNHNDVRLWLSRGLADFTRYKDLYGQLLLESSASTIKLLAAPQIMLNLSIVCYFLGFGLYLLYCWLWNVSERGSDFGNNFIFYVCVIGAIIAYIAFLWGGAIMDRDKVNQQFNVKRRFDTGDVDRRMDMLDRWTDVVDTLTSSKTEAEKAEARQQMDEILWVMRFGERSEPAQQQPETGLSSEGFRESSDTTGKRFAVA